MPQVLLALPASQTLEQGARVWDGRGRIQAGAADLAPRALGEEAPQLPEALAQPLAVTPPPQRRLYTAADASGLDTPGGPRPGVEPLSGLAQRRQQRPALRLHDRGELPEGGGGGENDEPNLNERHMNSAEDDEELNEEEDEFVDEVDEDFVNSNNNNNSSSNKNNSAPEIISNMS